MNDESTLAQVVKELQSSNLSQDLILDTIDNYDFTLASSAARENTTEVPTFLDRLVNVATDLKDKLDVLIRSNVVLAKRLEGNKLQERENRDELLDTLRDLKPDKTRTPVKDSKFKMPGGIFSGILSAATLLAGFAIGFVGKLTSALFSVLGKTKLFQKIGGVFSAISQFFTNIVTRIKASPLLKGVFTGIEKIAELVNKFKYSKLFISLTLKEREEIFKLFKAEAQAQITAGASPSHFFHLMYELTCLGYYTSEIGATKALRYVHIPSRYEACIPLQPGQKAWAT